MSNAQILNNIFARIDSSGICDNIVYPNVSPTTQTDTWLNIHFLPYKTQPIGLSEIDLLRGIVQVNVNVRENRGLVAAEEIAQQILDLFPRNLELNDGVRIDRTPWVSPGFYRNGWFVVPVNIEYLQIQ